VNFAFPALIILVLSLPGIFFRFAYRKGPTDHTPKLGDITQEIAWGTCVTLLIHLAAFQALSYFQHSPPFDFHCVFELIAGNNTDQHYSDDLQYLGDHAYPVSFYILGTTGCGLFLGWFAHWIIKRYYIDILIPAFRFEDRWEYLFNGAYNATGKFRRRKKNFNYKQIKALLEPTKACVISILVETKDKDRIYNGVLDGYELNAAGELDRLILVGASRMDMIDEPVNALDIDANLANTKLNFVEIEGRLFIIPYATVKNINVITFVNLNATLKPRPAKGQDLVVSGAAREGFMPRPTSPQVPPTQPPPQKT
jgi:hypothetical protein